MFSELYYLNNFYSKQIKKKILFERTQPLTQNVTPRKKYRANSNLSDKLYSRNLKTNIKFGPFIKTNQQNLNCRVIYSSVSQKQEKEIDLSVQKGSQKGLLDKNLNKWITSRKKKNSSLKIDNIDELNITSYRNFKIKSSTKQKKTKRRNLKQLIFVKRQDQEQKYLFANGQDKKQKCFEQTGTKNNFKDKSFRLKRFPPEKKYYIPNKQTNIKKVGHSTQNHSSQITEITSRKNSICAWEDVME